LRLTDSVLRGSVNVDTASIRARGDWRIEGDLSFGPNRQSLLDDNGYVAGVVRGSGPPVATQFLQHHRGMYCAELAPVEGGPTGYRCISARPGRPGEWRPEGHIAPG
jgi:hypothetical protein